MPTSKLRQSGAGEPETWPHVNLRPGKRASPTAPRKAGRRSRETVERDTETAARRHPAGCKVSRQNPSEDRATASILRKEVIQPQVPLRLPCYDFTPVTNHTVVTALPKVKQATSGAANSHGVTGGVYKARERIHRGMLIRDY